MLSKYETIGVGVSVALMALTLYLVRLDSASLARFSDRVADQPALVAVSQEGGLTADMVEGIFNEQGRVERLLINDISLGEGKAAEKGDKLVVNYIGRLQNGQEFDNSYKRGDTFSFRLGKGEVIEGWDDGLLGMRVGGQRTLVVPASLAYGNQSVGPIPAGATLIYLVELVSIN